jgi:hypothetical protein
VVQKPAHLVRLKVNNTKPKLVTCAAISSRGRRFKWTKCGFANPEFETS